MKKKLAALALMGLASAAALSADSTSNSAPDMASNQNMPMTPDEQAFANKLNPDTLSMFQQMNHDERNMCMSCNDASCKAPGQCSSKSGDATNPNDAVKMCADKMANKRANAAQ